jgi:CpeS-like protein
MNITDFFQQSAGKWVSQRTSHHPEFKQPQGGRSDFYIEALAADDPAVIQLCQAHGVDAALALAGVRTRWDGTMEQNQGKRAGSTLLVALSSSYPQGVASAQPNQGTLLQPADADSAIVSRYVMGDDDALTLIAESPTFYSEERLWFASPNLRLRTSTLKRSGGFSTASFCSEIRMGGVPPAQ